MKKLLTILSLSALLMTTAAYAAPEAQKIAVVDIQKVVAASSQVKALKASQDAKNKELTAFIKLYLSSPIVTFPLFEVYWSSRP